MDIAGASKKALSDIITQAEQFRTVLDTAPDAAAELERRAAESSDATKETARLARLAELRKSEEAAAVALAAKVSEVRGLLVRLGSLRTDIRNHGGGPLTGAVSPLLGRALESHLALVKRTHPEWVGLPRLMTRKELAIEDAELQIESAKRILAKAKQNKKDAKQQTHTHNRLIEEAELGLKRAKTRLKDVRALQ